MENTIIRDSICVGPKQENKRMTNRHAIAKFYVMMEKLSKLQLMYNI